MGFRGMRLCIMNHQRGVFRYQVWGEGGIYFLWWGGLGGGQKYIAPPPGKKRLQKCEKTYFPLYVSISLHFLHLSNTTIPPPLLPLHLIKCPLKLKLRVISNDFFSQRKIKVVEFATLCYSNSLWEVLKESSYSQTILVLNIHFFTY